MGNQLRDSLAGRGERREKEREDWGVKEERGGEREKKKKNRRGDQQKLEEAGLEEGVMKGDGDCLFIVGAGILSGSDWVFPFRPAWSL